jgi:hypothetical protein
MRGARTGIEADADPKRCWAVRLTRVTPIVDPLFLQDVGASEEEDGGGTSRESRPTPLLDIEWHAADALPVPLCLSALGPGAPVELRIDGRPSALRVVGEDGACEGDDGAASVAPASLSLQALIDLRRKSGHPVLLSEDGRVQGVCGDAEIVAALAARDTGGTSR